MNLFVHGIGALQNIETLLNQFEAEGVTDIRFVRQQINDHLRKRRLNIGRAVRAQSKSVNAAQKKCPDCNRVMALKEREGVIYYGCKNCYKSIFVRDAQ